MPATPAVVDPLTPPLVAVTVTVHVVPLGPGLQPGELGVSATTVVTFPFCANESEFVAGEM